MKALSSIAAVMLQTAWAQRWPARQIVEAIRHRRRAERARRARLHRELELARHGAVTPKELLSHLRTLGVNVGDTVFFQGSLNDMPTFGGNARDLLSVLRDAVGEAGTLLMPAYTAPQPEEGWEFVLNRTATYTGLVNELFRRSPGVLRSLHPRHSVCAFGPLAAHLTEHHERCERADGADSPFDRLRRLETAKFLTLGLPPGYLSFLHWVEDIDPSRFPWRPFEDSPRTLRVVAGDGTHITVIDWWRRPWAAARVDYSRVAAHLSPGAMHHAEWRGIACGVYPIGPLAQELLQLRDAGIVHYS